jgi:hypothetical protein
VSTNPEVEFVDMGRRKADAGPKYFNTGTSPTETVREKADTEADLFDIGCPKANTGPV